MANTAKSTYRFKTVMVEDKDRDHFGALRNRLAKKAGKRVTDKELFSAMWAEMDVQKVTARIVENATKELAERELKKLQALQAKVAEKLALKAQTEEVVETEVTDEIEESAEIAA